MLFGSFLDVAGTPLDLFGRNENWPVRNFYGYYVLTFGGPRSIYAVNAVKTNF